MKRHSIDWQGRDLFEDPAGGWVEYDDARAVIDGLQALLNERDAEIDRLTADARRYRYLMSPEVLNGTLGVTDGWIDFEFKEEAEAAIDIAIGLQARK